MKFGEKVRQLRKEHGWTQAELAKRASLSLRTIISYEKGEFYPKKRSTYDVLAEIFEVPSVELRSETDALDFQNLPEVPETMMEVIRVFNDPQLSGEEAMQKLRELWQKNRAENPPQ